MRISDWSSDVCSSDLIPWASAGTTYLPCGIRSSASIVCLHEAGEDVVEQRRLFQISGMAGVCDGVHRRFRAQGCALQVVGRHGDHVVERIEELHRQARSEEHTSELQSLMRISYAVFCLKQKKTAH